ncbi:MAG: hypothetical protein QNJ72_41505 [Pleurocapsa sp. MO_226.B13]|nr:hypothetical protein [Pleurocapsa sp. MO_226.B13]
MALLTAQIIGDKIVGVDIPVPPKGSPYGKQPFKIMDLETSPYKDISTIVNWEKYGHRPELKRDYSFVRGQIKAIVRQKGVETTLLTLNDPENITKVEGDRYLVGDDPVGDLENHNGHIATVQADLSWKFEDQEAVGYRELNVAEKQVAAVYNIGDLNDHEADFGSETVFLWNVEYHENSIATRLKRRYYVETIIQRDLPDYKEIVAYEMKFSPAKDLISRYSEHGAKGTLEDRSATNPTPTPAICDYLYSRSIFAPGGSNPGLSSKPWATRTGRPLIELVDEIYNILVYGIYS